MRSTYKLTDLLAVMAAANSDITWPIIWGVVLVAMLVVEVLTMNLVSIWFAVAALASLIAALLGASVAVQLILFVVVSAIGFLIFVLIIRPKIDKKRAVPTNADRIIGEIGRVMKDIAPLEEMGLIRVKGQMWSACTDTEHVIKKDSLVKVVDIRGVKAVVVPYREEGAEGVDAPGEGASGPVATSYK